MCETISLPQSICHPVADQPLQKYNLVFRNEYQLLVCCKCSCVLGASLATHLKAKHGISIPTRDSKIVSTYLGKESPYVCGSRPPLPMLDFLPVREGYRCVPCNHQMARKCTATIVPCKVQTLNSPTASCRT